MEIKPKKINIIPSSNLAEDEISTISTKTVNLEVDTLNILEHCDPIPDIDKLKEKLTKLGILFNTDPKVYQKKDYWLLICILYQALTHLYDIDVRALMVKEWLDPHSDNYIPTEKLVAESLNDCVTQEDLNTTLENYATIETLINRLSLKLDIIEDLEDIRFGSQLGSTALLSFTETDPTVPAWAKESTKPVYEVSEISGLTETLSGKQDNINDLNEIRSGSTLGSTALQPNDLGSITDSEIDNLFVEQEELYCLK